MIATKVFNNNAVATVHPDGREAILVGSGIGFGRRPGDTVDEKKIEKYILFMTICRPAFCSF